MDKIIHWCMLWWVLFVISLGSAYSDEICGELGDFQIWNCNNSGVFKAWDKFGHFPALKGCHNRTVFKTSRRGINMHHITLTSKFVFQAFSPRKICLKVKHVPRIKLYFKCSIFFDEPDERGYGNRLGECPQLPKKWHYPAGLQRVIEDPSKWTRVCMRSRKWVDVNYQIGIVLEDRDSPPRFKAMFMKGLHVHTCIQRVK